jgi:TolC family type I secretion outer membrane protein
MLQHPFSQDFSVPKNSYFNSLLRPKSFRTGCFFALVTLVSGVIFVSGPFLSAVHAETLEEALAEAYMSNPGLLAARAELRSVDEKMPQALSNYRPTISGAGSVGKANQSRSSAFFSANQNLTPLDGSISLTQPLYRGFRTVAETSEAENLVFAARADLADSEQAVLLDAITAYMNVLRDQSVLDLNLKNEAVLTRELEATRDQFDVGELTRTDVSQAEARLARGKADRIGSAGDLESSKAVYLRMIGQLPGTLVEPALVLDIPKDLEQALALADANNPQILSARYIYQAAKDSIQEAFGELLPEVNLVGEVSRSRNSSSPGSSFDNMQVTAQLNMPLYQAGSVSSRVREARQIAVQNRLEVEDARRAVREETVTAWEALATVRAQIESYELEIKANKIALEGVREEETVGARTVLDILNAEQEYLDSQVSLVSAMTDERIAAYELLGATGRLLAGYLDLPVRIYDEEKHYNAVRYKIWGTDTNND